MIILLANNIGRTLLWTKHLFFYFMPQFEKISSITSFSHPDYRSVAEDTVESPETPLAQGPVAAEIAQGGGEAPACEAEAANIVSNTFLI